MYTYYIYFLIFFYVFKNNMYNIHVNILRGNTNMYILKKDLEKYKDIYKYNYKLLDILIRYSLTLIKENIKDIDYINNVILDVKKILISVDHLAFNNINHWGVFFKENEKSVLVNDDKYSKKIKENYDMLAKLFVK